MEEDDDARHRREEAERRTNRKTAKQSRPQSERAKQGQEYRRKILEKHGATKATKKKKPGSKTAAESASEDSPSIFQNLFTQRAEGFQIEFKFRNAPPRPPVGPCFVGNSIDALLKDKSRQYQPYNAVEVNYAWKLHIEPDLGVPLAPSAMDLKSYSIKHNGSSNGNHHQPVEGEPPLHADDEALLNWKGPMGDTAAEALKLRQDRARAAARAALLEGKPIRSTHMGIGGVIAHTTATTTAAAAASTPASQKKKKKDSGKKKFSRVLDESMQTWMKKTTYLSNDYSRKVHDFKSLAQTKQNQAKELEEKQQILGKRRSAAAIQKGFMLSQQHDENQNYTHPTKKHLKVKQSFPLLPSVDHWKYPYTHVVMDKPPINVDLQTHNIDINRSFVASVEKRKPNDRLTCQLWMPPKELSEEEEEKDQVPQYQPLQQYDLDVLPLKEEDVPHFNFCIWIHHEKGGVATYVPISSRVQLSSGKPLRKPFRKIARRSLKEDEEQEMKERMAEIDYDMQQKLGKQPNKKRKLNNNDDNNNDNDDDDDDGVNDGMKINNAAADSSSDDDDDDGVNDTNNNANNNDDDDDDDSEDEL